MQAKAAPVGRRFFAVGLLALVVALPAAATAQVVQRFDLALKAGELPKDQRTIRVRQGEQVELRWTSERPMRLHLHGYDVEIAVAPGAPTVMALTARIPGRFPVEKVTDKPGHHHGGRVLYLEVHP